MSELPDSSFSEVTQVLRLKRHEVPPPGYFNGFSAKVIARIEADQLGSHRARAAGTWWNALLAPIGWQRGLAGANTLLFVGIGITAVAGYQALQSTPDEENVTWAALQLPPSSAPTNDRSLEYAAALTPALNPTFRSSVSGNSRERGTAVLPVSYSSSADSSVSGDGFTPASLFNPPSVQTLQAGQPRFVFPTE